MQCPCFPTETTVPMWSRGTSHAPCRTEWLPMWRLSTPPSASGVRSALLSCKLTQCNKKNGTNIWQLCGCEVFNFITLCSELKLGALWKTYTMSMLPSSVYVMWCYKMFKEVKWWESMQVLSCIHICLQLKLLYGELSVVGTVLIKHLIKMLLVIS